MHISVGIELLLYLKLRGQAIAEHALKRDEHIACRNATVLVDSRGNVSWINNEKPPVMLGGEANG